MIKVDTREKENKHIIDEFNRIGVPYCITTCKIGDYANTEKPNVYIERKNSWDELAGNCGKNHARFKRELERLDNDGGIMFLLVETDKRLLDWKPRHTHMKPNVMSKILDAWQKKHKLFIVPTPKEISAYEILKLLDYQFDKNE